TREAACWGKEGNSGGGRFLKKKRGKYGWRGGGEPHQRLGAPGQRGAAGAEETGKSRGLDAPTSRSASHRRAGDGRRPYERPSTARFCAERPRSSVLMPVRGVCVQRARGARCARSRGRPVSSPQSLCAAPGRYVMAYVVFFFQAEDGIRDWSVTGVQTCALPI